MRQPIDLSFYLVTHREDLEMEKFYSIISHSIAGGVKVVQLREKMASVREMCAIGRHLLSILKPLGVPLIVNDRVDVAHAIDADGVHLGQSDLEAAEARAILGTEAMIGISVETVEQVLAAESLDIDYIAASPVFVSKTKTDVRHHWGLEGLKKICQSTRHPVVGIGGINASNVSEVLKCGVDGVAVVSAVFNAACPEKASREIAEAIRREHAN